MGGPGITSLLFNYSNARHSGIVKIIQKAATKHTCFVVRSCRSPRTADRCNKTNTVKSPK